MLFSGLVGFYLRAQRGFSDILPDTRVNWGQEEGPGFARDPVPNYLPQLQSGDLVGVEHREPGVAAVGDDCDPERHAALHDLGLCDDNTGG